MWLNNYFPFISNGKQMKNFYKYENDLEFQNTFINLINLSTYAFKWEGLPETCNERYLELMLLFYGNACIVNDKEFGFLSLGASVNGSKINMYGEYGEIYGIGWNGFNKLYSCYMEGSDNIEAEAVVCKDNTMRYPYINYITIAALRLSNAMRSIDVASKKLKNPYFIVCDESQERSVKKIIEDIEGNKDSIITSKSTMPDMFKVMPTQVTGESVKTLWENYYNIDEHVKTILGIETGVNKDKKERLIVDEINASANISDINIKMRLKEREKFCENVNRVFGLNISVRLRDEMISLTNEDTDDIIKEEVVINEN